ncbi:MAG TPA: undecaprenyl-diphosphate phosphatase [Bryobacteraceae bacterium]|nr:undecaprenyl-diphosphate phosphatase [Bryobacteraceae bacterium]
MNDYILSLVLGVIEGLTEFLPVSSTAHLRIAEALLGVNLSDGYWKMFSIVIQLGAILCLPIYFWNRISSFIRTYPRGRRGDRTVITHPLMLTLIAFVCTAGPAFILTKVIGKNLERLKLMACALIVGGIVMWVVDSVFGKREGAVRYRTAADEVEHMNVPQAVWIGLCQVLSAVFPGTSRSMATIAAGQVAGLSRTAALEFSFLVSIPTMVVATGYDLFKTLKGAGEEGNAIGATHIDAHGYVLLGIGFVVSFIVAFAVVAWFMNWVRTKGFVPFAIYRIAAGLAVLIWTFTALR